MSAVIGNPLLLGPEGYQISRSVRLRSSASAYFNRTPSSSGSSTTWTWSGWIKRGVLGVGGGVFYAGVFSTSNDNTGLQFRSDDTLQIFQNNGATTVLNKITTQVFRDPSAWYHIVLTFDTTNATAEDRVRIYVNGVRVTAFSTNTNISQNGTTYANSTSYGNRIFRDYTTTYLDGYLTEVNFIDGQALTPSSFGETDSITGVWKPKKYAGTYGTNGFYLNFSDNSNNTAATIGKDYSGNGNNWTPNNISVTSGVTYDSMTDVPTLTSATAGNYATLNPLSLWTGSGGTTLSNVNLEQTASTLNATGGASATIAMSGGKFYWEVEFDVIPSSNQCGAGLYDVSVALGGANSWQRTGHWILGDSGLIYLNGSSGSASGTGAFSAGNIAQFAFDSDTGKLWVGKDNTWVGVPGTSGEIATLTMNGKSYAPLSTTYSNAGAKNICNFGQRPFAYTPPTGFKALNTQNLPAPTISNGALYMAATTYTGNGGTQSITNTVNGVSFKPDLVWVKGRSVAYNNYLEDSVRGVGKDLSSNLTDAEATYNLLSSFNSNGFTVFTNGTYLASNENGTTYVGWQWKAGAGTTSSNTSGSITSTVSVNATAGFSVVTYTGIAGNVAKTFGHGLGVAPSMVIIKPRTTASAFNAWVVWHSAFTGSEYIYLDLTNAKATSANYWGATVPSSTVVTVGGNSSNVSNESGINYVAYCWAAVPGYSAFGSYTGNGNSSDGPFVYLGFRPRYIMQKRTDSTGTWELYDTARDTYNVMSADLAANLSDAETSVARFDSLSNGFKIRTAGAATNASGGTYIYAAFAENPLKFSLAR